MIHYDKKRNAITTALDLLPKFPKTPHLPGSKHTSIDDVEASQSQLDLLNSSTRICIEEKIDGSNTRIRYNGKDELIVGNREHVLHKGYIKKATPSKLQYRPLWNWIYDHREAFAKLTKLIGDTPAIYAEWMYAYHSIRYNRLPAFLIIFDLMVEDQFLDPFITRGLVAEAGLWSPPLHSTNPQSLRSEIESPSAWSNEIKEGLYIKCGDGRYTTARFKLVRDSFIPRKDFNETELSFNEVL